MGCCCKVTVLVAALLAGWIGFKSYTILYEVPPMPDLPLNQWWGPGSPDSKEDKTIRPFKVEFKPDVIADLKNRLNKANYYTEPLEGVGFQYGFNNKYLKEVVEFWKTKYNFAEQEKFLNKYPHFKTRVQGLDMHFMHIKPKVTGKNTRVVPLLMLHGWPGSVVEFYKIIPMLTTEKSGVNYVFEVIAPSLPGYGFSQAAAKKGLGAVQIAVIMKNLMNRLGFFKYMIHGGDWGAMITSHMSTLYPEEIYGYHTTMAASDGPISTLKLILGSFYPPMIIEKEHESKLYPFGQQFQKLLEESGYFHIQATKPDTVGVALRDSPVGLAAYILEKFSAWTNMELKKLNDGGITKKFTLTELLDNIMVYYITDSITTSVRLYSETMNKAQMGLRMGQIPVSVPTTVTRCAHEIMFPTKSQLSDKYLNLVGFMDHENCGHFATFEEPKMLADDLWSSLAKYDQFYKSKPENPEL